MGQFNGGITRNAAGPPRLQSALATSSIDPFAGLVTSRQPCHRMAHSVGRRQRRFGRRHEGMCRVTSRTGSLRPATCWSSSCRRGHDRSALRRPTCAPSTGPGPQFRLGGRVAIHPLDPSTAFRTAVAADSTEFEPLRPGWKRPTRRSRRNAVRKSRSITSPPGPGAVGAVSFGRFRCRNSPGAPAGSSILVQESPGNLPRFDRAPRRGLGRLTPPP